MNNKSGYIFAITDTGHFFYSFGVSGGMLEKGTKTLTMKYHSGYDWFSLISYINLDKCLVSEEH